MIGWGNFNSNFYLRSFTLFNLKSDFFKILKPIIASDRENVLIKGIKLTIIASGNNPQHHRITDFIFKAFFFETNRNIDFFNRTREKNTLFSKRNTISTDLNKIFCFINDLIFFLRLFDNIRTLLNGTFSILCILSFFFLYLHILHHFFKLVSSLIIFYIWMINTLRFGNFRIFLFSAILLLDNLFCCFLFLIFNNLFFCLINRLRLTHLLNNLIINDFF